ncbi:MAG: hypothetical protein JXM68_03775 [Sedimentisphaerales bacterium]|nr:hypothetical protein [Sedimentisphaerales bacterium]
MKVVLYLIVLLLAINLCFSVWIASSISIISNVNVSGSNAVSTSQNSLISESDITPFVNNVTEAFNRKDTEKLWDMFGSFAKAQMDKQSFTDSVTKLFEVFGKIDSSSYLYHEFAGEKGNIRFFTVHYRLVLPEGTMGKAGEMKLTIGYDGKDIQLVRFDINSH